MGNKVKKGIVGVVMALTTLGVGAGVSFADTIPADPTGGAMTDVQDNTVTWILTYGVPVVFAMILVGVLIKLGIRWAKKAGRMVG